MHQIMFVVVRLKTRVTFVLNANNVVLGYTPNSKYQIPYQTSTCKGVKNIPLTYITGVTSYIWRPEY